MSTFSSGLVLASGVFDVIHAGHIAYLTAARKYGNRLVVAVTQDTHVNKGPGRPMFTCDQRMEALLNLRLVDDVVCFDDNSAVSAIRELRPEVYVKGSEYKTTDPAGNLERERKAVESFGGRLEFTDTMLGSSTAFLNGIHPPAPPDAMRYVAVIKRQQYDIGDILGFFDDVAQLDAVVAGEPIVDEYVYVEPEGKSAKETLVAFRRVDIERWEGGGKVVADHVDQLVHRVRLEQGGMAPIVKRRFVQRAFTNKLFQEVEVPASASTTPVLTGGDLAIVADFGHGLFTKPPRHDGWLGLTVQSNSLNWAFNLATKWPRADYVVLDENEIQLAFRDRASAVDLLPRLRAELDATTACVTLGHKGAYLIDAHEQLWVPPFTDRAVDRLGAGDAFLAWTAPFVHVGTPLALVGLIGSCAAALHVQKRGNAALSKAEVVGFVKAVMA